MSRCSDEEVRWRGRKLAQLDSFRENALRTMLGRMHDLGTSLWDSIWRPLLAAQDLPGFDHAVANNKCKQFLESARYRCLAFNTWGKCKDTQKKLSSSQMDSFLESKESFFEHLPDTAEKKFDKYINDTFVTKYEAVKGLIDLHNGENVDVHMSGASRWKLLPLEIRFLRDLPEQFMLGPGYSEPTLTPYDRTVLAQHMSEVSAKCQWHTSATSLRPDFAKQWNRLVVPCQGTRFYCWVRSGRVISLGELFLKMHLEYNAREIYELYLHLDIVSIKRRKPGVKNRHSGHKSVSSSA